MCLWYQTSSNVSLLFFKHKKTPDIHMCEASETAPNGLTPLPSGSYLDNSEFRNELSHPKLYIAIILLRIFTENNTERVNQFWMFHIFVRGDDEAVLTTILTDLHMLILCSLPSIFHFGVEADYIVVNGNSFTDHG